MKQKLLLALLALFIGVSNASAWDGSEGKVYIQNVGSGLWWGAGTDWGTRASLIQHPEYVTLHLNNGVYTLESQVSNGGTQYYFNGDYMDNGSPVNLTITASGDYWTIANGDTYYGYDGATIGAVAGCVLGKGVDGTTDNGKWKIFTEAEMLATLENATEENPVDATFLLLDPSMGRNNRNASAWTQSGGNNTLSGGDNTNCVSESWQSPFETKQTATVPNGYYKLTAQTFLREYTATGTDLPYIYLNDAKKDFNLMVTVTASLADVSNYFTNGTDGGYYTTTDVVTVTGKSITVGAKGTRTNTWAVWDNFVLQYLGPLDLSEFANALAAAVTAAEATQGTIPTACYDAIAAVITDNNKTYDSEEEYEAAIQAINNAVSTYATADIVADYTRYKNIRTAVLAINPEIDVTAANTQVEAATTTEGIDAAILTLRNALTAYLPTAQLGTGETIDLTDALIDNAAPGISGTLDYWTNSGNPTLEHQLYEYWNVSGATTKQTLASTLPAGNYKLTAIAYTRDEMKSTLNAGNNSINLVGCGSVDNRTQGDAWIAQGNGVNNLVFNLAEATTGLEIGLTADNTTSDHWMCWRSFRLVYGNVFDPYTLVTDKMSAAAAQAQATAETNFNNNPSPATYMALMEAIAAAQASAKAYAHLTATITKIDEAIAAATSATESVAEVYNTIKTAYNDGTIADADIMSKVAEAYDAVIPVIKSQTAAQADFTLAIQNQSFEYGDMTGWTATTSSDTGVRDAANATYATTGSDGYYLFNTWWQGVPITQAVTDLPNGQYTLTVSVSSDGATIYLIANGEHNEGIETGGEHPSSDTFQETTFTFLVKDGNATIGAVGGADGTAGEHKDYVEDGYWWYKADNFRLVKNRELTPEEIAVIPENLTIESALSIYKGNSATLNVTSTTENATIEGFVTWISDNPDVATVENGVVTALAYGTANITVTSTLNSEATATCAVTVTAPLITEAQNLDFAEGPVISNNIRTYAKDIQNQEVSGMQAVTGWSFGVENGDAKAAGVMAYGSSSGMGSNSSDFYAPTTNPNGEANGNALGMVGVWTGQVQYVQPVKIPAGVYTITVPIYRNGGGTALTKNLIGVILDDGTEYLASTKTYDANSWKTETINFAIAEETYGKLSLGLNAPNKGSADCQRLWIDGITVTVEPFADAEDYEALNQAISTAETKTLGFDIDEYAPYNNITVLETLAAAKDIDQNANNAKSTVNAATTALTNAWVANTEEVSAISLSASYDATNVDDGNRLYAKGWGKAGGTNAYNTRLMKGATSNAGLAAVEDELALFTKFGTTYGEEEGYTMPLKANTIYKLSFKFGASGENKEIVNHLAIVDGEGNAIAISPESFKREKDSGLANESTDAWFDYAGFFKTSNAGNYVLTLTKDNNNEQRQLVMGNIVLKKAVAENVIINEATYVDGTAYEPVDKYANVTFNRTLVEGWNGLVLPFDMTVDDAMTKFNATLVKDFTGVTYDTDKGATLVFSDATEIKAGKPFMIKSAAGSEFTFDGVLLKSDALQTISQEAGEAKYTMTGTYQKVDLTNVNFVLIQGDKYYQHNTNKASSAKAFRAYFLNESTGEALSKGINIDFNGEATGIKLVEDGQNYVKGNTYNLQGQKVNHAQKGVYIVNGKKIVVK